MQVLAAIKIVPDDQDIQVASDRSLDYSKARPVVSEYDLNALEAAAQLAAATDGSAVAVTVGPAYIDDSKTKKNILARGIDELYIAADDAYEGMDAHQTAEVLSKAIENIGDYDLIVCGDGSADLYAKQTGAQLADQLGVPYVAGVASVSASDGKLDVKRMAENDIELLEVPLPAVISVIPEAATPRIPGMKDILAAGKKPMNEVGAGVTPSSTLEVVSCLAPEQVDRKLEIMDAGDEDALQQFANALKAAL